MRIFILTTFVIAFSLNCFSQQTETKEKFYKATIKNITLDVPEGFVAVEGQQGFLHKGSSSTLMIADINNAPYEFTISNLTTQQLEKNGAKVISTEKLKTDAGYDAVLYTLTFYVENKDTKGTIEFERLLLFTGNENTTVCLAANYPVIIKFLISEPIRKSLLSVKF